MKDYDASLLNRKIKKKKPPIKKQTPNPFCREHTTPLPNPSCLNKV